MRILIACRKGERHHYLVATLAAVEAVLGDQDPGRNHMAPQQLLLLPHVRLRQGQ